MKQGFSKFKRKLRAGAVIRSLVLGFSVGSIFSSLCIIIAKTNEAIIGKLNTLNSPTLVLLSLALIFSAIAIAAVVTAISIIATFPTNKRIAKKLDRHFSLDEKVQTMIAFRSDESEMSNIQRSDTERILSEIPKRKLRSRFLWVHFIFPIIAVILLISAAFIPIRSQDAPDNPPNDDPPFTLSAWQEEALKDLIEKVRTSDMEGAPKLAVVSELEDLLETLKNVDRVSKMKSSVIGTITRIKKIVNEHNTYDLIASEMMTSDSGSVSSLGSVINSLNALSLTEEFTLLNASLEGDSAKSEMSVISAAIDQSLSSSAVSKDNALYLSLSELSTSLSTLRSSADSMSAEEFKSEKDRIFAEAEAKIGAAMLIQYTNERVADDAVIRLMQIFGIKENELPADAKPNKNSNPSNEGDYKPEEDDDPLSSGGLGSGDMIFGSDDMIYDPESGKYVSYGEVINGYYKKISELIVDGNISEDLEKLLTDYFSSLFNGSEKKED